jgi:cytidylate kinase
VYRVVCISGTDGAGAEVVAGRVAAGLGFRLIDDDIIARAAREAGVEPHVVADVELRKSFLRRLVKELERGSGLAVDAGGLVTLAQAGLSDSDVRGLIRSAIEEIATSGEVVIASHAASLAVAGREDALRVLITASPEARRERMAAERGLSEREAAKTVADSDAGRADYLRRFYGIEAEQPTHYDLVVSTDRVSPEAATEIVLGQASRSSS